MKGLRMKWWHWALGVVGLAAIIGVVAPFEETPPPDPLTQPVRFENVRDISPPDSPMKFMSVVVPAGVGAAPTEAAARALCDGQTSCIVLGFDSADAKASAMPMTDRELAALVFSYSLSRGGGLDESVWKCSRFSDVPAGRCMAD